MLKLKIPSKHKRGARSSVPSVTFYTSGLIVLNIAAAEGLKIETGESLAIGVIEGRPLDWYLIRTKNPADGLVSKSNEGKNTGPKIQCTGWTQSLREALGETEHKRSIKIQLSNYGEDTELGTAYALLTKAYLDARSKKQ